FAPGPLANSGLHYGLELSVAEAEALEATGVRFSQGVSLYLQNFLELPVGTPVPLGYYDRTEASWQTAKAGRVIEVLDIDIDSDSDSDSGVAMLDIDGDGEAEDNDVLEALDITRSERQELAAYASPGESFWWGKVEHFSPWNVLLPVTAPPGASVPTARGFSSRRLEEPSRRGLAMVETQASVQSLGIVGTPYSLRYQSDRSLGYGPGLELVVPVIPETVPDGLELAASIVDGAGQRFTAAFEPEPDQAHVVEWDGRDGFGRLLQGPQTAEVSLGYVFEGTLAIGEVFGIPELTTILDGQEVPFE